MNNGIKIRKIVHNVLYEIYENNLTLDAAYEKYFIDNYNDRDIAFINNVCLNSMRFIFHCRAIINLYSKKTKKINEILLLNSSITQIVFLNFKEYAVVNSSVELAKHFKIYHGFINAILKNIIKDKEKLRKIKINYNSLPKWFRKNTNDLSLKQKNIFLNNFYKEPNLHLVFKKNSDLVNFKEDKFITSSNSAFLKNFRKVVDIYSYKDGNWWVQDFSSSLPINSIDESLLSKRNLDMCAAPGGKSFQIMSKNKEITMNDVSKKRLQILKTNIKRLGFNSNIINQNFTNLKSNYKYDFIVLDAPCSSVGTIRKNPEIFYRKKSLNLEKLISIQYDMLTKASVILNKKGIILYMVCSFLKAETFDQINKFLHKNKNFSLINFNLKTKGEIHKKFVREKCIYSLPSSLNDFNIDGYFAALLKKNT